MQLATVAPAAPARQPARFVFGYIPALSRIQAALLRRDGTYNVGTKYYPNASDAARFRRLAAERFRNSLIRGVPAARIELRELLRQTPAPAVALADRCAWCSDEVHAHEGAERMGGRWVHDACLAQLDVVLAAEG